MTSTAVSQNGGAGAVPEKHAGVAIAPIGNRSQLIRADHQDGIVSMRGDKLLRDLDPEEKSSASCGYIETSRIRCADLFLDETGRGRKKHVWRSRGDQD